MKKQNMRNDKYEMDNLEIPKHSDKETFIILFIVSVIVGLIVSFIGTLLIKGVKCFLRIMIALLTPSKCEEK